MHASSSMSRLQQSAHAAGIEVFWTDAQGRSKTVSDDVLTHMLSVLGTPHSTDAKHGDSQAGVLHVVRAGATLKLAGQPGAVVFELETGMVAESQASAAGDGLVTITAPQIPGYHHLLMNGKRIAVAVSPGRAPSVDNLTGGAAARVWGPVAQVYSLRDDIDTHPARSTGYGDFTALAHLARAAAAQGAHALAVSPVHAGFAADLTRFSPYAPSSRLFLNTAYADPCELFEEAPVWACMSRLGVLEQARALENAALVDWPTAAGIRMKVLRALYDNAFRVDAPAPEWRTAFESFVSQGGDTLQRHARFEALHAAHAAHTGEAGGWQSWTPGWRDPTSTEVDAWAHAHADEVRYHAFTQWLAARGLAGAQAAARDGGMAIGLIGDLAVGTDPGGSHAWSRQADLLKGLTSGAPPDIYNPLGQGWGLTAFSPAMLKASGYTAFIEMLRAVLAHAGGIRIDHVLGLARTWLIPDGAGPAQGAYLRFPLDDMLQLIALEAWRHQAIVIGENLGTVPAGFNDTIESAGMLGMNVLFFERGKPDQGGTPVFTPSETWPENYLVTTTTHDLPTLAGWWQARDLDWKVKLDVLGPDETESDLRAQRRADRQALHNALFPERAGEAPDNEPPLHAMLDFTTRGPQPLALVPLEDLLALIEQPNIPGTIDTHPNWRRRLDITAATLFDSPIVRANVAAITTARSVS